MGLSLAVADADELPPRTCPRASRGGAIALALMKTPSHQRMALRLDKSAAYRVAAIVAGLLRRRAVGMRWRYDPMDGVLWLWRDDSMARPRKIHAHGPILAAKIN